jgi:hypothetical protein
MTRKSIEERVGACRATSRAAELHRVQSWVPETPLERLMEERRRQSAFPRDDSQEAGVLDLIEAAIDTKGWV